ncbi:M57 family metalloprotease [Pontibacter sp. SGAir0037]|uniref:M57 family metalloprotease n=1 Tax=Pontibacter sp. SGAir0037 TaxID=2571030 RepID=UPI0010CCEE05|nr:M57 family metalloprotease [Pontibacter sp. SGAir0037]QCR24404.1 protease [Pontibacter sp. SGAir0037]
MKTKRLFFLSAIALTLGFTSCQQEEDAVTSTDEISEQALIKISQMGFSNQGVQRVAGGYLVEGDIMISEKELSSNFETQALRVGEVEQYRTNNLVSVGSSVRTINVAISTTLPQSYVAAVDEAIRRYNAENLRIRFARVSSGYNILLTKAPNNASYLASAGFPSGGNPYNQVLVNSTYMGSNPGTNYLATVLAHELGHCIGFRHTDYMDRSYSCGGAYTNEGASSVGAVHIPGTPTTADATSWMLACVATGQNRPFNANDRIALNYLY